MLTVGTTLKGRYRIDAVLGEGGMARVYKAWDRVRSYWVAIKALNQDFAEDREIDQYFQREAQLLAKLAHRNIVRFYSYERDGLTAFIVMDYIEGSTLRSRIFAAAGPLPQPEALAILEQTCAALHYAHEEGVVHRDVKPANIMLQPDGRVLLSDFGIGKAIGASSLTLLAPGTPAYMAPEQWRGQPVDRGVDMYSLGVVAYEMLAGRRPFTGLNPSAPNGSTETRVRWEHLTVTPPALDEINPCVSRAVSAAVLKALAKEPAARHATAAEFWEALAAGTGLGSRSWTAADAPNRLAAASVEDKANAVGPEPPAAEPAAAAESSPVAEIEAPPAVTGAPSRRSRGWVAAGVAGIFILLVGAVLLAARAQAVLGARAGRAGGSTPTPAAGQLVASRTRAALAVVPATTVNSGTRTPTETREPEPTLIPTVTLTQTAEPASPTPTGTPTATPTSTATQRPTPRPVRKPVAPVLLRPLEGESTGELVTFAWRWSGPALKSNEGFEVRLWKADQSEHYGAAEIQPGNVTQLQVNLRGAYGFVQGGNGVYYWTVAVAQRSPYKRTGPEAPARKLLVNAGGGGPAAGGPASPGGGGGPGPVPIPTKSPTTGNPGPRPTPLPPPEP